MCSSDLLRFLDIKSDLQGISRLKLRPSSLLKLEETNEAVIRLGQHVQSQICKFAISPLNAGSQFVHSFTFTQMTNHMTHYALLGDLFQNMSSPVNLKMIMYNAYQTMHSTGLAFSALKSMSPSEQVVRFGLAFVSRHTACQNTSRYNTDYGISAGMTYKQIGRAHV